MMGTVCGATDSVAKIYLYCLNCRFGAHCLWGETLFMLDTVNLYHIVQLKLHTHTHIHTYLIKMKVYFFL